MNAKADFQTIRKLIVEVNSKAKEDRITETADLFASGNLDSYATIQLVLAFERVFDIVFDYADLNARNFTTIESIIHLLTDKYACEKA